MATTGFADFEQHYLALMNWMDQGTLSHFNVCRAFVSRRVPCKIVDGPDSVDKASTLLLGRPWKNWSSQRHDRTLELLDLYERAGYVDGARPLAPIGVQGAQQLLERPARRLPLASAMHFRNTAATVLLLDRGLLRVTDVRPDFEAFVREYGDNTRHLLTPHLKSEEAFAHFAALHWEDDSIGLAKVTEALMRHHLREHGVAPAATGAASARRASRAAI